MDTDGDQNLGERGTPEEIAQAAADEGVIEGGSVSDFQEYEWAPEKKHRAETARYLTAERIPYRLHIVLQFETSAIFSPV